MSALEDVTEALIQAAYMQIAGEKMLTVQTVGAWGDGRAKVPGHWREEATKRAQPYITAVRSLHAEVEAVSKAQEYAEYRAWVRAHTEDALPEDRMLPSMTRDEARELLKRAAPGSLAIPHCNPGIY